MIREIAAKSLGAQIKIMSSKETERELQDCVVTIAGSLKNKQDACGLIVEQIEGFRNGQTNNSNSKTVERDNVKNEDRNQQAKESPDRYLVKRQEHKKKSRSRTPDRLVNQPIQLARLQ